MTGRMCVMLVVLSLGGILRAEPIDYERNVRPLFAAKCAACHGALEQQANLRLDAIQLLKAGGDGGPAVIAGDLAGSLVWRRVTAAHAAERMPPEGEGEHLSAAQLEVLRNWIEAGAPGPATEPVPEDPRQYWSYRPPHKPPVPVPEHAGWVRTPIDAFVAADLEARGLAPRVEAPREVWLRRVYLDLIGVPPSRDELHAFLVDTRRDADERVVDNLLARPGHGQRWGRHWMDVWRYSDWYGSRAINEVRYSQRHIWRWRDWIVDSLNADRPYDRMVVEMLAGDEVAPHDPDAHRATGFLARNWYKFDRDAWLFETVEHTAQAFLGLTLRCARCHDHKFDPVSQEDYYRFRAFFEPHDVRTDPLRAQPPTEKDSGKDVLAEGVARVFDKQIDAPTFLLRRGDPRQPDQGRPLVPGVPDVLGGDGLVIEPVALPPEAFYPALRPEIARGLIAAADAGITRARETVVDLVAKLHAAEEALAAFVPAAPDGAAPEPFLHDTFADQRDIWRAVSGDWAWREGRLVQRSVGTFRTIETTTTHPRNFHVRVRYRTLAEGTTRSVGFSFDQNGTGDSQDVYTSANDQSPSLQAFHRKDGKQEYPAAGVVRTPIPVGAEVTVEATVRGQSLVIALDGETKLEYVMPLPRRDGKFALWVHAGAAEFLEVELRELLPTRADLEQVVQTARDGLALSERQVLTAEAEAASVRARLAAERARHDHPAHPPDAALADLAVAASRAEKQVLGARAAETLLTAEQHLATVLRIVGPAAGDAEPSAVVAEARTKVAQAVEAHAQALAACDAAGEAYEPLGETYPATSSGRRLALARWITGADHPRTSRIAVNHLWRRHFGRGLVPSVANFGLQGERPSHPELLDWLATEFVAHGWRMKPLHRQIVLSAAYRQSSSPTAATAWDAALDPATVDPANRRLWHANPHRMEAELVRDAVLAVAGRLDTRAGGPEIPESEGQTNTRRSLYFRLTPNEKMSFLETFDAPDPNACYERKESVMPHQALALMNSGLALDGARAIATLLTTPPFGAAETADGASAKTATARDFVTAAFEQVLTRRPTPAEERACLEFLERHAALLHDRGLPAFPGGSVGTLPPSADPAQRARENLVHVLLNHHDFVTIR